MERTAESGVQINQPRCPFCHEEIAHGEPQLACNTCRAWHHQACWGESGQQCAACGSGATGFVLTADAPEPAPGDPTPERRHDPTKEFRFTCPHCKEGMWAPNHSVGRTGVCPSCKRETTVPKVGAPKGLKASWQSEIGDGMIGFSAVGLLLGGAAWFACLIGEVMGVLSANTPPVAFRRTFAVVFILGLLLSLALERDDAPKRRIAFCVLLGIGIFLGAWWAGATSWVLAALLPPWPLILLGYLLDPPPPEAPPPIPGKAPWQGE